MAKRCWLDPAKMCSKEVMKDYIAEMFGLQNFLGNLDELNDCLSEVAEDTIISIHREAMAEICNNEYSYRVLMVLVNASENNPHLIVHLRLRAPKESL